MVRFLKNRWFGAIVIIASLSPVNAVASNALERMEEVFLLSRHLLCRVQASDT